MDHAELRVSMSTVQNIENKCRIQSSHIFNCTNHEPYHNHHDQFNSGQMNKNHETFCTRSTQVRRTKHAAQVTFSSKIKPFKRLLYFNHKFRIFIQTPRDFTEVNCIISVFAIQLNQSCHSDCVSVAPVNISELPYLNLLVMVQYTQTSKTHTYRKTYISNICSATFCIYNVTLVKTRVHL